MADLRVNLSGWELDNPVIASSGTYGYGALFTELYDIDRLGSFAIKGTTREERFGNPQPRTAECTYGVLSSVGLQNPGIDAVLSEELPKLAHFYHKKVLANVCGFSVEEYAYVAGRFDACEQVGIIEVNLSCPNVRDGGMSFGTDPELVKEITRAVKSVTTKPVYVKLTSAVSSIVPIAAACQEAGADGICMVNTMPGIRIDLKTRRPVLGTVTGGYSTPAMFPIAARMVYQAYKEVDIPIIGLGGITTARDVLEMMMCGASAVQVGSANLLDPMACIRIIEALPEEMEKYGIEKISDIVGAAH